jgi:hypothetical protein
MGKEFCYYGRREIQITEEGKGEEEPCAWSHFSSINIKTCPRKFPRMQSGR